jgi:predicted nucleotidyltransferase
MKPSEALELHRDRIREIVEAHHGRNARVFGSVLRGEDHEGSDLDIVFEPTRETTLLDIGAIRHELRALLKLEVDVVTPKALPEKYRSKVLEQAQSI